MNRNIEHYVFHKKNFLEESFCVNSINELNKNEWAKHDWTNPAGVITKPAGDNEPEIIYDDLVKPASLEFDTASNAFQVSPPSIVQGEINNFIVDKLESTILEYIESLNFGWYYGCVGLSDIKFIRYFPGQTMQNHCDHIHGLFDGKRKGIPILSIIGILNDDYEGGELIMFGDKKIDTKAGDLLIFPSNFIWPHEITPVSKGVRYSYVSWVW